METYAKLKYSRISPFRARKVADLIRKKNIEEAYAILHALPQRAAKVIFKILQSSIANAVHNYQMDEDKLYISRILIDQGTPLRRVSPRAQGRADIIKHRTSHITVYVNEKES
jgi:large subunit ribosomal protein L22